MKFEWRSHENRIYRFIFSTLVELESENVCVCVCLSVRKTLGQDISTSFNPIPKLFGFSERGDNSVGVYFSFFENFDLGRRGSLSKIPLFWRLKPYFSMKESSDWVENIHLGQFEYGEFKNELTKKKYWRLPGKLFIKQWYMTKVEVSAFGTLLVQKNNLKRF